jgi:hypothetical protein
VVVLTSLPLFRSPSRKNEILPVRTDTELTRWTFSTPPDAERLFAKRMGATVVEVNSNHLPMVSHPDEVVKLINAAVEKIARTESLTSISR